MRKSQALTYFFSIISLFDHYFETYPHRPQGQHITPNPSVSLRRKGIGGGQSKYILEGTLSLVASPCICLGELGKKQKALWAGAILSLTQHARLTDLGFVLLSRCTSRRCFPRRARKTQLERRRKKSKGRQRRVLPLPREESRRGSRSSKEGKVPALSAVGFLYGELPPPTHRGG